ncbi:MAG TPA: ester cyclase [Roseiflexaceae bacterium]|nr:ester cyclase [Roseiflexaceae bacterium]
MTTEQNKAALRRFREAVDAGDVNAAVAAFAPDALVHMPGAPEPLNLESFSHMFQTLLTAFPGGKSTIEDLVAEGDKVVSRLTFRGTHTGDLMGIPPTGKTITIAETIIDRFADGKIVESWRLFDQMGMMQQLGVIPEPAH